MGKRKLNTAPVGKAGPLEKFLKGAMGAINEEIINTEAKIEATFQTASTLLELHNAPCQRVSMKADK